MYTTQKIKTDREELEQTRPALHLVSPGGSKARVLTADFAPRSAEPRLFDPIVDEPVWTTIFKNVKGIFHREELPPLVLTSKPVAVRDPFRVKRNPASTTVAVITHVAVIAFLIWLAIEMRMHQKPVPPRPHVAAIDITPFRPIAPKTEAMGGGGGGGAHVIVQAPKGRRPKVSPTPGTQPMVLKIAHRELAVEPTIKMPSNIQVANNNLPNLGDPRTSIVGPASNGTGSGSGMGIGDGGGIGSGSGSGYGADEASRAKFECVSVVSLIVDAHGMPQRIRVSRKLGMGLDEKAVEAVSQYRFKPSMYQGKPVPVEITVEVNFHLY